MKRAAWFYTSIATGFSLLIATSFSALFAEAQAGTFVYECDKGFRFSARVEGDDAWLFLPGQTVKLPHVVSGSGARYSDDSVMFWSKGEEALLEVGSTSYRHCKSNRSEAIWEAAKLDGVDFRAVGNEPGWHLEVREGQKIVFVTDYGKKRYDFMSAAPQTDQGTRTAVYRSLENVTPFTVTLKGEPCTDTMSGEKFATTVVVRGPDNTYRGCGRALH